MPHILAKTVENSLIEYLYPYCELIDLEVDSMLEISPFSTNACNVSILIGRRKEIFDHLHLRAGYGFIAEWYDDYHFEKVRLVLDAIRLGRIRETTLFWKESYYGSEVEIETKERTMNTSYRIGIVEPFLGKLFGPTTSKNIEYEKW